jgi:hypothetical protein
LKQVTAFSSARFYLVRSFFFMRYVLPCAMTSSQGSVIENVYIINLHTFSAPIATLLCHPSIEGIRSYGTI